MRASVLAAGLAALTAAADGTAWAQRGADQPAVVAAREATARISGAEAGYGLVIGANEAQVIIATARHVVDDAAAQGGLVTIDFAQLARRRQPAEVVKGCEDVDRDIAFLRTSRPAFSNFPSDILAASRAAPAERAWVIGRDSTFEISPEPGRVGPYDRDGFFALRNMRFVVAGVSGAPAVSDDGVVGLVVRAGAGSDAEAIAIDAVVELAAACELLMTAAARAPAAVESEPRRAPSGDRTVRVVMQVPRNDPGGNLWDSDRSPPDFGVCFTSGGRSDCRPPGIREGSGFALRLSAPCQDVYECSFDGVRLTGGEVSIFFREIDYFPEPWGEQRYTLRCRTDRDSCASNGFRIRFVD